MTITSELDQLVESSRERSLSPKQLLELQSDISALRYTLGEYLTRAEEKMLSGKDRLDLHIVRSKFTLQAKMKGLTNVKAEDMVTDQEDTELMRQSLIRAKVEYSGLKHKLLSSGDVLVSLAQRIKRSENERITSAYQTGGRE